MGHAPKPTPPQDTAAAQTGTNIGTAIANNTMGNMNQVTPFGTQTFTQTGTVAWTDPYTGQTYQIPQTTVNQTLAPAQQAILDQHNAGSLSLATTGANLARGLSDTPFNPNTQAIEGRLWNLGTQRLNPMFNQQQNALESKLANQGVAPGTEAYRNAMQQFSQGKNDAYNSLLLSGRGQAYNELMGIHNQQINDATGLLGQGQVQSPNYIQPSRSQIPTTDVASLIANNDAQRQQAWQQQQSMWGSALGSIGGLFSLSDMRAKDDIQRIGETSDGMGLYSYRYKGSPKTEIGLMAQEVAMKKPHAVAVGGDGLMRVNYEEALQ